MSNDSGKQEALIRVLDHAGGRIAALAHEQGIIGRQVRVAVTLDGVGHAEIVVGAGEPEQTFWDILPLARSGADRVAEAKRLLKEGKVYPLGCSQFVCAVLGIPHEVANSLMGEDPAQLGDKPPYNGLAPGDIVGWTNTTGSGHVAVYVGESDSMYFIDVREPGAKPRSKNGYYDHMLYKSERF